MIDIEKVKQWAVNRWTLGEKHGLSHWERVERNGHRKRKRISLESEITKLQFQK